MQQKSGKRIRNPAMHCAQLRVQNHRIMLKLHWASRYRRAPLLPSQELACLQLLLSFGLHPEKRPISPPPFSCLNRKRYIFLPLFQTSPPLLHPSATCKEQEEIFSISKLFDKAAAKPLVQWSFQRSTVWSLGESWIFPIDNSMQFSNTPQNK